MWGECLMKSQGLMLGLLCAMAGFWTMGGGGCAPDAAPATAAPDDSIPNPEEGSGPTPDPGSTPPSGTPADPGTPPPGTIPTPEPDAGSPPDATPAPDAGTSVPPEPVPVPGTDPDPRPPPPLPLPDYGANLLLNSNAEEGSGSRDGGSVPVPHWTLSDDSGFTAVQYGAGFLSASDVGPLDWGFNFFAGGQAAESTAVQDVDVARLAPEVDEGAVQVMLSGYLGGFGSQEDNATVTAQFRTADGLGLGSIAIGPVRATDRLNTTGLLYRKAMTGVPVGTRSIRVVVRLVRVEGTYNDGYVDNLLLVLKR